MSAIPISVVDAFTSKPFSGNPAGVVLLDEHTSDRWALKVAGELNLSETAFLVKKSEGHYDLRWFTPTTEVDLCGHATLASAHWLYETGRIDKTAIITFHTKSGELIARRSDNGISLDFPLIKPEVTTPELTLIEALGMYPQDIRKAGPDYIFEVPSERDVVEMTPDFPHLKRVDMRGVIVTARGESADIDFVSRFFAPAFGIDEDPVTGSAHCALAPYWEAKLDKTSFRARQLSARGGELMARIDGDRVILTGQATTIWNGELTDVASSP